MKVNMDGLRTTLANAFNNLTEVITENSGCLSNDQIEQINKKHEAVIQCLNILNIVHDDTEIGFTDIGKQVAFYALLDKN